MKTRFTEMFAELAAETTPAPAVAPMRPFAEPQPDTEACGSPRQHGAGCDCALPDGRFRAPHGLCGLCGSPRRREAPPLEYSCSNVRCSLHWIHTRSPPVRPVRSRIVR